MYLSFSIIVEQFCQDFLLIGNLRTCIGKNYKQNQSINFTNTGSKKLVWRLGELDVIKI